MIDLGLTREQILRKYSPEEYDEALRSMSVKHKLYHKSIHRIAFFTNGQNQKQAHTKSYQLLYVPESILCYQI